VNWIPFAPDLQACPHLEVSECVLHLVAHLVVSLVERVLGLGRLLLGDAVGVPVDLQMLPVGGRAVAFIGNHNQTFAGQVDAGSDGVVVQVPRVDPPAVHAHFRIDQRGELRAVPAFRPRCNPMATTVFAS